VLDAWVNEHTGGLIEESAIEPDPLLRLVLQNAILLAARWETPFQESTTSDEDFTGPDGTAPTEMLHGTESWTYATHDGWAAVRLPYADAFHADVLLPPSGTDPAEITPETLDALLVALDTEGPVLQQAYLSLDEDGTVAAAVTEIGMETSGLAPSAPAVRMTVDHPYLLRIAHTETSLPLFLTAVRSPQH
jgi:serine protease inhibitor